MSEMLNEIRTRFAPSPTGFMHVGNLRTALYAYLLARSGHGKFVLRIEDTDQNRLVDNAVEVIYNTLKSAGLKYDEGPNIGGEYGPYVQSERKPIYKQYAEELVKMGKAYYCFCDKVEVPADEENTPGTIGYDGRCRNLSPQEIEANLTAGKPYVIRQKINKEGSTSFHDLVFGDITIENKVLDDQILLKRDGMPTYNFANVIDDHLMKISHVVRGSEYLPSTPKYNLLYQFFGWTIPQYIHLPLIMGRSEDGTIAKLSKRHGSVSFENLVEDGYLPEAIINYISLLGWSPKNDRELFTLAELEETFSANGLNRSPAVFDYGKLRWMNGEYVKRLTLEEFTTKAEKFAEIEGTPLQAKWSEIAGLLHQRIETFKDIPKMIAFLIELPAYDCALFFHKKSKSTPENALETLKEIRLPLVAEVNWSSDNLYSIMEGYATSHEVKLARVAWALRIAVAGLLITPGGAPEIMSILGKDSSLNRIDLAITKLSEN